MKYIKIYEKFFSKTLLDKLYALLWKYFKCRILWKTAIEFTEYSSNKSRIVEMKSFINIEKKGNYIKITFNDGSRSAEFAFIRKYLFDNFKLFSGDMISIKNDPYNNGYYDEIKFKVEDYDKIVKLISKFPQDDLALFKKIDKYNL